MASLSPAALMRSSSSFRASRALPTDSSASSARRARATRTESTVSVLPGSLTTTTVPSPSAISASFRGRLPVLTMTCGRGRAIRPRMASFNSAACSFPASGPRQSSQSGRSCNGARGGILPATVVLASVTMIVLDPPFSAKAAPFPSGRR